MAKINFDRLRNYRLSNLFNAHAKTVTELTNGDNTALDENGDVNLSRMDLSNLSSEDCYRVMLIDSIAHCTKSKTLKRLELTILATSNTGIRDKQMVQVLVAAKHDDDARAEKLKEKVMKIAEEQ
jgi:hypothetical protein